MLPFIPSDSAPRLSVLADAFAVVPPAVARAAIAQHTRAGDLIVDPFCAGLGVIQAALDLDRRIVAASFNPINTLAIEATLWPRDARTAFTHLADARKGGESLRDHLRALYATRCPTCGRTTTALSVTWDRDYGRPVEKHVRCAVCGENIGPIEEADLSDLKRHAARGLPFWLLHERVIEREREETDRADRVDRVGEVLEAYTPRTLAALSDIMLKVDTLSAEDQAALRPALLATFDAGLTLHAPGETRYPHSLKPPPRFVERNVWAELESQATRFLSASSALPRAASIEELLTSPAAKVCVLAISARELARQLPAESVALLVTHPPLPRPALWSLSAVWAAWLWGKQAAPAEHLRPLLSRKRTSWDWQWRAIGSALSAVRPASRAESKVFMVLPADEAALDSIALAAAGAGYHAAELTCDPLDSVRAVWSNIAPPDAPHLTRDALSDLATQVVRQRAEPTPALILRAALLAALGQAGNLQEIAQQPEGEQTPLAALRDLIKDALEHAPLAEIDPHVWWLKHEETLEPPLADRVELAVVELLRARDEWDSAQLLQEIYRRFPDQLTPDRALVATALHAYADETRPDRIRLRAEDQIGTRQADLRDIAALLTELGQRAGYELDGSAPRLLWRRGGETVYVFVVQATGEAGALLRGLLRTPPREETRVLVIPGGRATLLQHKLTRDARLRRTPWQVLKFSALRRAAQEAGEVCSPETLQLAFGLEPPIDRPATQLEMRLEISDQSSGIGLP
jgi:hypothetical protein